MSAAPSRLGGSSLPILPSAGVRSEERDSRALRSRRRRDSGSSTKAQRSKGVTFDRPGGEGCPLSSVLCRPVAKRRLSSVRSRGTDPNPLVVAIDGPAAAGKSTTARAVAKRLDLTWIDTGAMYRAVTLWLLRHGIAPVEGSELKKALDEIRIELSSCGEEQRVLLCGEDVTSQVRDVEVTRQVSRIARLPQVRDALVTWQRQMASQGRVVMEGRDIGTVVCPDAPVKVFLMASLQERAERRTQELIGNGHRTEHGRIEDELQRRDTVDSTREHSPLRAADDAVVLDTTSLTFEEQVQKVIDLVREKGYR